MGVAPGLGFALAQPNEMLPGTDAWAGCAGCNGLVWRGAGSYPADTIEKISTLSPSESFVLSQSRWMINLPFLVIATEGGTGRSGGSGPSSV